MKKAFLIILAFAIVIRLNIFDYPLNSEETNRDFLISRHIVQYGEFPSLGPRNGTLPDLGNSPAYYYFLSGIFKVYDNPIFVSAVNLTLQILAIVLVYLIVKSIFGLETALISTVFLSSSKILITASIWPWQPYIMYFFLILSFYLLFLYHKNANFKFLAGSIFLFCFSLALHMSVFAILPPFWLAIFVILKSKKIALSKYFLTILVFVFSIVVFFGPPLFTSFRMNLNPTLNLPGVLVQNQRELLSNVWDRIILTFNSFNPLFVGLTLLFSPLYLSAKKGSKKQKNLYLFLLISLFSFIAIFSFINGRFFDQHLYPIYPILAVLAAESIRKLFTFKSFLGFGKYLLVFLLAINLLKGAGERASSYPLEKYKSANEIAETLAREVRKVSEEEMYPNFNFFQFRIYSPEINYWWGGNTDIIDSIYWVLLENEMDYKFTEASDSVSSGYKLLNSDNYLLLNCLDYENQDHEERECFATFNIESPNYKIVRKISGKPSGNSFYVAKKITI